MAEVTIVLQFPSAPDAVSRRRADCAEGAPQGIGQLTDDFCRTAV